MSKIVIFSPTPSTFGGGYETFIAEFIGYSRGQGVDVSVARPPTTTFLRVVSALGLRRRFFHLVREGGDPDYVRILRSAEYIYVKNELLDLLWLRLIVGRRKIVIGFHTRLDTGSRWRDMLYRGPIYQWLMGRARLHFVTSPPSDRAFMSREQAVIPNGVDFRGLQRQDSDSFRLLYAGRLSFEKGPDRLANVVNVARPNWTITIAGDGPESPTVEALAHHERVFWLGRVSRSKMQSVYASSDILLLPSRWEIVPFVLIEAIAAGLLPVAQDIPELRNFLGMWPELLTDFDDCGRLRSTLDTIQNMASDSLSRLRKEVFLAFKAKYESAIVYERLCEFIASGESTKAPNPR